MSIDKEIFWACASRLLLWFVVAIVIVALFFFYSRTVRMRDVETWRVADEAKETNNRLERLSDQLRRQVYNLKVEVVKRDDKISQLQATN